MATRLRMFYDARTRSVQSQQRQSLAGWCQGPNLGPLEKHGETMGWKGSQKKKNNHGRYRSQRLIETGWNRPSWDSHGPILTSNMWAVQMDPQLFCPWPRPGVWQPPERMGSWWFGVPQHLLIRVERDSFRLRLDDLAGSSHHLIWWQWIMHDDTRWWIIVDEVSIVILYWFTMGA